MTSTFVPDLIERQIVIEASRERVWDLVSRTGFWVGESLQFGRRAEPGETVVLDSGRWGVFPVRVESLEPQRRVTYRWASGFAGQELTDLNSTLVEFDLLDHEDGILVRVRESGFARLEGSDDFRLEQFRGNDDGWATQMESLRREAERVDA